MFFIFFENNYSGDTVGYLQNYVMIILYFFYFITGFPLQVTSEYFATTWSRTAVGRTE
jgi:hypothetical protein